MRRIALWALLSVAPVLAQNNSTVTKLVILKNIEPQTVQMLSSWGVALVPNGATKSVAISGPQDKVAAVEAAIKQLDVPAKSVELTVYFVVGGDQATLAGTPVPQDLRDVIAQLKGAFPFKEYKMLDTLTLRSRSGSSAETSGILNAATPPRMSQFSFRNVSVSEDGGTIRIDRMHAGLRIPYTKTNVDPKTAMATGRNVEYTNSGIDQDVDVKVGQKVVVGRSSMEGPQQALFLILTATVIQ